MTNEIQEGNYELKLRISVDSSSIYISCGMCNLTLFVMNYSMMEALKLSIPGVVTSALMGHIHNHKDLQPLLKEQQCQTQK